MICDELGLRQGCWWGWGQKLWG